MSAWYNEPDPFAAQWLRNLIVAGHIAPGVVDERPIQEIEAWELIEFTQCHFFAGIGIWSHALRRAGWPDDRPIWTGSCPCQPFSNAGQKKGFSDERHLWPYWQNLITERKPGVVVGEQVESAREWIDLVSVDLERTGYAFGTAILCAAGFEGAHIRHRNYFVGLADNTNSRWPRQGGSGSPQEQRASELRGISRLADPSNANRRGGKCGTETGIGSDEQWRGRFAGGSIDGRPAAPMLGRTPVDWLYCRDGKWRPVEPGTFPLAHEAPARVGRLRAYGNALDAETATQFCSVIKEICDGV